MTSQKLTFAGSIVGEPWWSIGDIVSTALATAGYEVEVSAEAFSHHNLEFVHLGRAQVGVTTPGHFAKARSKTQKYVDMDVDVSAMRALAVINRPQWLAIAFAKSLDVTSLADIRAANTPIHLLGSVEPTGALYTLLEHYSLSIAEIESWGGSVETWKDDGAIRDGGVDVVFGRLYSGYTPHMASWYRAAMSLDLEFAEFPEELIATWVADGSYERATLPNGFLPGVGGDLSTVGTDQVVIYCKEDLDEKVISDLVRTLDEHSALFMNVRTPLWYERSKVAVNTPVPLHEVAARYYASVGYPLFN